MAGVSKVILGNLEARDYRDQQGQTRTSFDVRADEVQLLGSWGDAAVPF